METAIVFFAGQTLETAVADSVAPDHDRAGAESGVRPGRRSRTRCAPRSTGLFDCETGVYIDVKTYPSFASVNLTPPLDANGNFQDNMTYQPGGPGDIVVVRLFYQWPIYVSLLQNMAGNKRLLVATAAFRNEPFGATRSARRPALEYPP